MRKILGIDPGITGGISIIDEQLNVVCCFRMPTVKVDKKNKVDAITLYERLKDFDIDLAIVEKVGARPGQGVVSMFRSWHRVSILLSYIEIVLKLVFHVFFKPMKRRIFDISIYE